MNELEAHHARLRAEKAEVQAEHAEVLAVTTGLRRAVLKLHGPVWGSRCADPVCRGCGVAFPCRTYRLARDWDEPV